MARSKLQQMMEGDIEDMRKRAQEGRERAETATADALNLEGQIDNYKTLIARAGDYEPGSDDDEPDDDEPDDPTYI